MPANETNETKRFPSLAHTPSSIRLFPADPLAPFVPRLLLFLDIWSKLLWPSVVLSRYERSYLPVPHFVPSLPRTVPESVSEAGAPFCAEPAPYGGRKCVRNRCPILCLACSARCPRCARNGAPFCADLCFGRRFDSFCWGAPCFLRVPGLWGRGPEGLSGPRAQCPEPVKSGRLGGVEVSMLDKFCFNEEDSVLQI